MNRLSVRLTLAIVLTTLLAVGVVAIVANQTAGSEFRRYLAGNDSALSQRLAVALLDAYRQTGSWDGLDSILSAVDTGGGQGMGRGRIVGQGRGLATLVADADGRVMYDSQGRRQGEVLGQGDLALASPIDDGSQTVGYVLVKHGAGSQLPAQEQAFLDRINQALLLAAGLALLLGTVLGLVLARTLASPLAQLQSASEAIAAGDLSQRVPETGSQETRAVARSFNQMAENLDEAEQLRRNLVADVAHELRTPLTVIQGNLQALLDGVYPLEKGEIATIYDETRLLSRLVADLRELAEAEAGRIQLQLRPTDLAGILTQLEASFAPVAEAKEVYLSVGVKKSLPLALADPDRLGQVLRNLLSNALLHSPVGGEVRVWAERKGDPPAQILVSVEDNGPGLPPEQLAHVFDRFWRADLARSRDKGGSGLGLAIARYLVEAQGGQIGAESSPGQGTRFWFTLAVVQE